MSFRDKNWPFLSECRGDMLAKLKQLVKIDSGSYCKTGIDECGRIVRDRLINAGFAGSIIRETECGNHLLMKRERIGGRRLLSNAAYNGFLYR